MATTTAVPKTRISGGSFLLESRQPDEVFTPEDFTEQHLLIGQTAEEFAVNEIVPNIEKIEHKDFSVTRDLLKKAGELGLSSVEIPGGLRRPRDGQGHGRGDCRPHRQIRRLCHDLGRAHRDRHSAHSFISGRKNRRRNICRDCPRARLWARMRCRSRLRDRMR